MQRSTEKPVTATEIRESILASNKRLNEALSKPFEEIWQRIADRFVEEQKAKSNATKH